WNLTLTGTGYEPHDGQEIHAAAINTASGQVVGRGMQVMDASGELSVDMGPIAEDGERYTIVWYADLNGSGDCSAPPADHAWRLNGPPITMDMDIPYDHDTRWEDVCANF
ncbi:MAG: hypothetical protein ACI9K2_002486, partial [Myxococcota bacterium]